MNCGSRVFCARRFEKSRRGGRAHSKLPTQPTPRALHASLLRLFKGKIEKGKIEKGRIESAQAEDGLFSKRSAAIRKKAKDRRRFLPKGCIKCLWFAMMMNIHPRRFGIRMKKFYGNYNFFIRKGGACTGRRRRAERCGRSDEKLGDTGNFEEYRTKREK